MTEMIYPKHSTITISNGRSIDTDKLTDDQYKRALIIGLSAMVELGQIKWKDLGLGTDSHHAITVED